MRMYIKKTKKEQEQQQNTLISQIQCIKSKQLDLRNRTVTRKILSMPF